MSCAPPVSALFSLFSKRKVRWLALICVACLSVCGLAQSADKKAKKSAGTPKPATAAQPSSAKAESGNQPAAASEEEEEAKGPWHGLTWTFVGLRDTHAIGRIVVNPKNPDIALVAALGHPFGPNPERGIFRTTDGGKTWNKVLYKDENTGGIDLAFDPGNANNIFAGLWQSRRSPWEMSSGAPGRRPYRPTDGGTTSKRPPGHALPGDTSARLGVAWPLTGHPV